MKTAAEKRRPKGFFDIASLAITTLGVGYLPLAPGTWGSLVAIAVYATLSNIFDSYRYGTELTQPESIMAAIHAGILIGLMFFVFLGIWATNRSIAMLGSTDAPQAVVDEVMGQLIVFLFIPFTKSWILIGAGFLLFRLFDIWKPFPIDRLQGLDGGVGICADDIAAGICGGIILSVIYAVSFYL